MVKSFSHQGTDTGGNSRLFPLGDASNWQHPPDNLRAAPRNNICTRHIRAVLMRSWQKTEPGCEWEFHPKLNLYLSLHAVLPSFGIPHHLLKDVIIQTLITYGNRLLGNSVRSA